MNICQSNRKIYQSVLFAGLMERIMHFASLGKITKISKESMNWLALCPNQNILDIATGTGRMAYIARNAFPSSNIVAIDNSDTMLQLAKAKNRNYLIDFKTMNAFDLGNLGLKFDAIIVAFALHEFTRTERIKLYEQIKEVLNNKGLVLVVDYAWPLSKVLKNIFKAVIKIVEPKQCCEYLDNRNNELCEKGFSMIKNKKAFHCFEAGLFKKKT